MDDDRMNFPRFALLDGPTPIQRLRRLEQSLGEALGGVRLFVKRDDLMGVGGGGSKLRKLEFLLGEALAQGCDTFIAIGGIQSNHARLSAAAAARAGLACELVLTRMVPRDDEEYRADALAFAGARAATLRASGRRPYVVGLGGSTPLGCLGYAECAREIVAHEEAYGVRFARIVVPNGSSGTHAGLAAGMAALHAEPARIRVFAGLLADLRRGAVGAGAVLFIMTGGIPGLFAYRPAFDGNNTAPHA